MNTHTLETRPQIAVLPDAIIDQIAAGEVVERPASVVKELVENALDAYATEVDVHISDGGRSLVRVTDNGLGMAPEAARLALRRHATSKIRSMDDLAGVATLGFRGEALPSIASVSRLEMITRALDAAEGVRLAVTAGRVESSTATGAPVGTTIHVRDLFFNVPARRKFLKTPAGESRRVAVWMTDLALSRPDVGFRYRSEDRVVFNVAPDQDRRARTGALLGHRMADALLELENRLDYVEIQGLISRPDLSRSHRGRVYLYVNGRRVQDRTLVHALTSGYGEYLAGGRYPVAVVFITLPHEMVDVNVHPTKAEVRFLHPRLIHDALFYTVNRVLGGAHSVATMAPGDLGRPVPTSGDRSVASLREAAQQILRFRRAGTPEAHSAWHELYRPVTHDDATPAATSQGDLLKAVPSPGAEAGAPGLDPVEEGGRFFQFARLYIVAPTTDALIVMDQHTAHERVLYEAVAERINADLCVTQSLLFPISIELEPGAYEVFEQSQDLFERTGFHVRPFGHRTVLIEGSPAVLGGRAPDRYFREILETLTEELRRGRDRLTAVAASFACRAAVKAGDALSETEMAALFDHLFATKHPFTCPHGRPTVVRIPRDELDRKFGRA